MCGLLSVRKVFALVVLGLFGIVCLSPTAAMAQRLPSVPGGPGEDRVYENCLRAQLPEIQRDLSDRKRAFDPKTGRNFAYQDGHWIDVKTGKEIGCPVVPLRSR